MNFVVAYKAEALPLIEFYSLKKIRHHGSLIYQNDHHSLIISGPGKDNVTSAIKNLLKLNGSQNQAWLNLGIAGHESLAKGGIFIAAKIQDESNEEIFYPPQIYSHSISTSCLITLDTPSSDYRDGMGFDMEAYAFYKTVSNYSIREIIQVIKIVSDNPSHSLESFTAKEVPGLIAAHIDKVDELVKQIEEASEIIKTDNDIKEASDKFQKLHHFSVTRTHQLNELVHHAKVLRLDLCQIEEIIKSSTDASDAIKKVTLFLAPHRKLG